MTEIQNTPQIEFETLEHRNEIFFNIKKYQYIFARKKRGRMELEDWSM